MHGQTVAPQGACKCHRPALEEANSNYGRAEDAFEDMDREMDDVTDGADDMDDDIDEAGDAAEKSESKFKGLSTVLKKVGAAMGAVVVATGAAAIKLGKEIISAYADYEQLVGDVDTLFKDSSQKLQQYAANAYQGFAKQNYTMLDNLKLGYGGTKQEMERLLADAQAISGIEYNIDSYADVVEAIHVIQTSMDITGTTAREAEHTISGSINSMQAALQNLMVGFGNADADME